MRSALVIVVHRVGHWAYHRIHIPIIRQVALLVVHVMRIVCMGLTQCEIASKTDIGPRLHLAHGGSGVVVHADARIGADCTIWQHVTIGGKNGGVPVIGDGVLVGAGAVILGGVRIGDGARIGANAVVLHDVPAGATAVGVPAHIIEAAE